MRILIGSDHLGHFLKEDLKSFLRETGHEPIDVGCSDAQNSVDYPDIALDLASKIADGEAERGVLICGTGIGMAIAANKVRGVRAAVCHDPYSAERSRASNNAQIIAFGALVVGAPVARKLLAIWLEAEFQGGRSQRKVEKINQIDAAYRQE
jgi:ribose 5-phosphate isomerase B